MPSRHLDLSSTAPARSPLRSARALDPLAATWAKRHPVHARGRAQWIRLGKLLELRANVRYRIEAAARGGVPTPVIATKFAVAHGPTLR